MEYIIPIIVSLGALFAGFLLGAIVISRALTSPGRVMARHNRLLTCGCGHHLSFHDGEDGPCHNTCHCVHYRGMTPDELEDILGGDE